MSSEKSGNRNGYIEERFSILSRTGEARIAADRIGRICDANAVPPGVKEDILLAIDEAVSNIIQHGYRGQENGRIEIICSCLPGVLKFSLVDSGCSFRVQSLESLKEQKRKDILTKGGYGLILMHELMDSVAFFRVFGHNLNMTVMKKKLPE